MKSISNLAIGFFILSCSTQPGLNPIETEKIISDSTVSNGSGESVAEGMGGMRE